MTMTSDAYWFEAEMAGGAPWDADINLDLMKKEKEMIQCENIHQNGHEKRTVDGEAHYGICVM